MSIDPRLIERRKTVAEDNAKRSIGRLLKFLVVVVAAGAVAWLVFSPWLSVSRVETSGIEASSANVVLADSGVRAGTPMILLSPDAVERALLADPWIAEATVSRDWPDLVRVHVRERIPVAWVRTADGWSRHAVDGVAVPSSDEPDATMGRVEMPTVDPEVPTPELLGALEFMGALDPRLHEGAVVTVSGGELWAEVSGYSVRLGRASEMAEKALSLAALLQDDLPEGTTVNLIAPTNPATLPPSDGGSEADDPENQDDETPAGDTGEGSEEGSDSDDEDS